MRPFSLSLRPVLAALALLALTLRALTPAGFMLQPDPEGRLVVALCTQAGAATTVTIDLDPDPSPAPEPAPHAPCPVAAAAPLVPPPAAPALPVAVASLVHASGAPIAAAGAARGLAAPPPWATGPPR